MRGTASVLVILATAGAAGAAEVSFTPSPPPATEAEMVGVVAGASLTVGGKTHPLPYRVLFRSGDQVGGGQVGLVVDRTGQPVRRGEEGPFVSDAPDANSLIRTPAGPRLVTHFEFHSAARLPMLMTLASLEKKADGALAATKVENIDFSGVEGLWTPCAGSLTPWNSHLGGEEYEPDARTYEAKPLEAMNLYKGTPGKGKAEGGADPYRYGFMVEVALDAQGLPKVSKRLAMGRFSHEQGEVMPDKRTVYLTDDIRGGGFFMFVADRENDLSSGTLYAARWEGGNLAWVRLGHAEEKEIAALIDKGIRFSDIFDTSEGPASGFLSVQAGGRPKPEYLRVRPGMEKAAAFLETRRYANLRYATTEFTKMEGVAVDPNRSRLYTAVSTVEGPMLGGRSPESGLDHIRLTGDPQDLACGTVYGSDLREAKDSWGQPIASEWVAINMVPAVTGGRKPQGQTEYGRHDTCDTDRVANPDNLKFSAALDTLFIGEDSSHHKNNFLWAWQPKWGRLTRLLSAPAGAEVTGLQVVEDLDGHAYLMTNIQHPGAIRDGLAAKIDKRGVIGYLGPLPALRRGRE